MCVCVCQRFWFCEITFLQVCFTMQVHNRVLEEPMSHVYVITTRLTRWFVGRSIFVCLPDSNLYQEVAKRPSGSVGIETS